ncbi:hypothetical protein [Victivallis sp. Marseille-Q1083]|uniref:hypothetical protein n=1 Tax=Victivallis sp. Marseille-Q1083 TaxID=2717288 RepID=UPI001588B7FF|nr:hypothetical protein [Victivallis sp. Marseille-Q1083]
MIYKREKIIIIAGVTIVLLVILAGYIRMAIMRIPVKEVSGFEYINSDWNKSETLYFSHGETGKARLITAPIDFKNENYFYMRFLYTDSWRKFLCFEKDGQFFLQLFSKHILAIYKVEPNSEFALELKEIYDNQKKDYELRKDEIEDWKQEREKYIKMYQKNDEGK